MSTEESTAPTAPPTGTIQGMPQETKAPPAPPTGTIVETPQQETKAPPAPPIGTIVEETTAPPAPPTGTVVEETTAPPAPPTGTVVEETTAPPAPPTGTAAEETTAPPAPPTGTAVEDTTAPTAPPTGTVVEETTAPTVPPTGTVVEETTAPTAPPTGTVVEETAAPTAPPTGTVAEFTTAPTAPPTGTVVEETTAPPAPPTGTGVEETTAPPAPPTGTGVEFTTAPTAPPTGTVAEATASQGPPTDTMASQAKASQAPPLDTVPPKASSTPEETFSNEPIEEKPVTAPENMIGTGYPSAKESTLPTGTQATASQGPPSDTVPPKATTSQGPPTGTMVSEAPASQHPPPETVAPEDVTSQGPPTGTMVSETTASQQPPSETVPPEETASQQPPLETVPPEVAPATIVDNVDVSKICENAKNVMSTLATFEERGLPKDWQSIRKSMFPGALREAKDVEAMFDETWTKLRKQLEAKQCLWSVDDTSFLCAPGEEEKTFKQKAELVDDSKFTSVTDALTKLNTLEGHIACPEGYCVVYSENEEKFFLLCRREISQNVLEKGIIHTSSAPEGWEKARKEFFPTTTADSKDVEAMYDVYWERLRAKLVDVPLWSEALTCEVCQPGEEEASFKKKAELLNDAAVQGVTEAVKKLNTEEGHIACPEGFCVVFSQSKNCFVLLHRADVPPDVLSITPERFSSSLPAATTTVAPTATLPTASRVSWPEARSEFFVESIKTSERKQEIEDFHKRDSVIVETSATSGKQEEFLWAVNQTHELCELGGERIFEGKAELLQKDKFKSVLEAASRLNSWEGRVACPEGYCVVFSERRQAYYLMYRADKKQEAFEKFSLADA